MGMGERRSGNGIPWVLKAGLNNNWLSYRIRVVCLVLSGRLKSEKEFRL